MEKLTKALDIDLFHSADKLIGACPVHDGDNPSGFNINVDPESQWAGAWFCNTQKCHEKFPNDILGLIQGILSRKMNKEVSFQETLEYIESVISVDKTAIRVDNYDVVHQVFSKKTNNNILCYRDRFVKTLTIPCPYFTNRGFSKEVLEEFGIGFCSDQTKPMYNRSVFPIFNPGSFDNNEIIGVVGRSIEKNPKEKWKFSKGFSAGKNLFGYNKAYERMKRTGSAVLVEGQGDVLRLYEAGILNCVGIFGCDLNDEQSILLERASVDNIILALDNDKAGQQGRDKIIKKYGKMFNLKTVSFSKKDIGELTVEEIQEQIMPQIKKYV
jgi:DNA primase